MEGTCLPFPMSLKYIRAGTFFIGEAFHTNIPMKIKTVHTYQITERKAIEGLTLIHFWELS